MDRETIEFLRAKVSCAVVLVEGGFSLDARESTRRAAKFRRGGEIIIVTHGGAGWFDPLSDEKGDVFALAIYLERLSFAASLERIRRLAGLDLATPPAWTPARVRTPSLSSQWDRRQPPTRSSFAWHYLHTERAVPSPLLRLAVAAGVMREGPQGSAWFCH